jgi:hypothetical protein
MTNKPTLKTQVDLQLQAVQKSKIDNIKLIFGECVAISNSKPEAYKLASYRTGYEAWYIRKIVEGK